MVSKSVFAVAVLLGLSAGQAFAEGEGNCEPFTFLAVAPVAGAQAFVSDAGSEAFPSLTGNAGQPSSLALLQPSGGSEAPVQSANSVPRSVGQRSVASVHAAAVAR